MISDIVRSLDYRSIVNRFSRFKACQPLLAILLGCLWSPFGLTAQESPQTTKAGETPYTGKKTQVVVLSNGKTLRGIVNQKEAGIEIKIRNGGIRTFPHQDVRLVQPDLQSAYQQLSQSIPIDSVPHHMELIYWCRQNNLLPEMVKELKLVLVLNKDHEEAAKLLKEYLPKVEGTQGSLILGTIPRNNNTIVLTGGSPETLTGLPPQMAAEFSGRVQPLLRSKCGSTQCHGTKTTTNFQLFPRTRSKSKNRAYTQNNLLAALSQLNYQQLDQSPLWVKATTAHGNLKQPVLHQGNTANLQKANLTNWIIAIAQYLRENPESELAKQLAMKKNATEKTSTPEAIEPASGSTMKQNKEPEKLNGILLDDSVISEAIRQTEPDVFDPAEFNQK